LDLNSFSMMQPRQLVESHRIKRLVVTTVIALFAIVQVIGAGHYHSPASSTITGKVIAADICPVCLHHSHSTLAISALPSSARVEFIVSATANRELHLFAREYRSNLFGRAPPSAV
jgi:hypothetical protein